MFTSISDTLVQWYKSTNDRNKLQHSYLAIALGLFVIAGMVGLLNYALGQSLLQVAYGLVIVFLVNAVFWALLQSFVFIKLANKSRKNIRK